MSEKSISQQNVLGSKDVAFKIKRVVGLRKNIKTLNSDLNLAKKQMVENNHPKSKHDSLNNISQINTKIVNSQQRLSVIIEQHRNANRSAEAGLVNTKKILNMNNERIRILKKGNHKIFGK